MIRLRSAFSSRLLGAIALAVVFGLSLPSPARADFTLGGTQPNWNLTLQFAVLGQFGAATTTFNSGTVTGDIGIGSPRQFSISNGTVIGNVRFSGASNTNGLTPDPDPGSNPGPFLGGNNVTGGVFANDVIVFNALTAMNNVGQALGLEPGTNLGTLNNPVTIQASAGVLDAFGNRVFVTNDVNVGSGETVTINGSASDYVVINVTDSNPTFGRIAVTGGITSDQVLINIVGGNYTTHTGGGVLTVNTNQGSGGSTVGIFLNPNGRSGLSNTVLNGRYFGGDTDDQTLVSGAFIDAPDVQQEVPEPASLLTLALALTGLAFCRRKLDTSAK